MDGARGAGGRANERSLWWGVLGGGRLGWGVEGCCTCSHAMPLSRKSLQREGHCTGQTWSFFLLDVPFTDKYLQFTVVISVLQVLCSNPQQRELIDSICAPVSLKNYYRKVRALYCYEKW